MRNVRIAFRAVALAGAVVVSAAGQQFVSQSSQPVQSFPVATLDLPVEPVRELPAPTLAGTAARNDYPAFDALYQTAAERGESASAFAELHDLWTWSLNNRVGAFYGQETHDRLASKYAGYAAFIDEYRIIDARGSVFYPTFETRRFLLDQAVAGVAPRHGNVTAVAQRQPKAGASTPGHTAVPQQIAKVVPPAATKAATPSAVAFRQPLPATPRQTVRRAQPAPASPRQQNGPVAPRTADARFAQGLFLTILGIIGVGTVTLMLHAPGEKKPTSHGTAA